jgi:hypothetical protein
MVHEGSPELVSFDVSEAVERAVTVAEDDLWVVAELTSQDYNLLYVSEMIEQRFSELGADIDSVAEQFHRYETLDFFEQDVFDDLLPMVDSVSAFATFTDESVIVRLVSEADEGLYVSVDRSVNVTDLIDELEPIVVGE